MPQTLPRDKGSGDFPRDMCDRASGPKTNSGLETRAVGPAYELLLTAWARSGLTTTVLLALDALAAIFRCAPDQSTSDSAGRAANHRTFKAVVRYGCTDGCTASTADGGALLCGCAGCNAAEQERQN